MNTNLNAVKTALTNAEIAFNTCTTNPENIKNYVVARKMLKEVEREALKARKSVLVDIKTIKASKKAKLPKAASQQPNLQLGQ